MFVVFNSATGSRTIGPIHSIECSGGSMRISDSGERVAHYQSGYWLHRGMRCTTVQCRSMLWIQFAGEAGTVGPVAGPRTVVVFRGPYVFAGRERVAKLGLRSDGWVQTATAKTWTMIRILATMP